MLTNCCSKADVTATTVNEARHVFEQTCSSCKPSVAAAMLPIFFQLLLGPPPGLDKTRTNLRSETNQFNVLRTQSLLGPKSVKLNDGLAFLFELSNVLPEHTYDIAEAQLVHLFVARHVWHNVLCDTCRQHRFRDCDYKNHPLFLGKRVLEHLDHTKAYLASWNLDFSDVEYLLVDGPNALAFKFLHFVRHLDPCSLVNPFDARLKKSYRHSVEFAHFCICSSLFLVFSQLYAKFVQAEVPEVAALQAAQYASLHCGALVRFVVKKKAHLLKTNCDYNLARFGILDHLPLNVPLVVNRQRFRISANLRGVLSLHPA